MLKLLLVSSLITLASPAMGAAELQGTGKSGVTLFAA